MHTWVMSSRTDPHQPANDTVSTRQHSCFSRKASRYPRRPDLRHWFQEGRGVIDSESGYMQGRTDNPTYKDVCYKDTGHAEVVKVTFDKNKISYEELLEAFFKMHDPTQLNRQGPDVGSQYRSGIYTVNDEQARQAKSLIERLTAEKAYSKPIVTEVEPAKKYYAAEDYHQDYIQKTGRMCHVVNPWTETTKAAH